MIPYCLFLGTTFRFILSSGSESSDLQSRLPRPPKSHINVKIILKEFPYIQYISRNLCFFFSSCYASVMLNHSFPIGQGIHYFERDFDTYYDSKNCTFEGIPCQGLIQVEVLPPKIRFPFLFQKLKDGSKNYPICSLCSENESTKVCKHKDHLKS